MSRSAEDNAVEFGVLSKQGKDLRLALLAACSVEKGTRGGDRRSKPNQALKMDATAFGKVAGTKHDRVLRHLEAWDRFAKLAKLPLAAKLWPEDAVTLVITTEQAEVFEDKDFALDEKNRGTRVTPTSVAAAVKANPQVAAAATQALVDKGDIRSLSRATAAVAQNRQVERNRTRVTEGLHKGRSVTDQRPSPVDQELSAFLSMHGLPDALRALVTTFPQEWAALSDAARTDDIVALCEETLDKIEIAVASIRGMISGDTVDAELEKLLSGGEE